MENNQNNDLTVWQRLSKAFGPNSLLNQDYPVYQLDKKELLKTTSKAEYEREKFVLQAWQRPTLPCFEAKYHWRCGVSLPSSKWDRVFHPRYNHQASNTNF